MEQAFAMRNSVAPIPPPGGAVRDHRLARVYLYNDQTETASAQTMVWGVVVPVNQPVSIRA